MSRGGIQEGQLPGNHGGQLFAFRAVGGGGVGGSRGPRGNVQLIPLVRGVPIGRWIPQGVYSTDPHDC